MIMNIKTFQDRINKINNYLSGGSVAEAINLTMQLMEDEGSFQFKNDLEDLRQTYKYMLHYFVEGMADDSRDQMYRSLISSLRNVLQKLSIEKNLADSSEIFYSTARVCRHRNITVPLHIEKIEAVNANIMLGEAAETDTSELRVIRDNLMRELFDALWSGMLNKDISSQLSSTIKNMQDENLAGYILSALIFSLLYVYDKNKLNIIVDVYENTESEKLAARSLVGIVLVLDRYKDIITEDGSLKNRLDLWNDSILTYSRLRTVIKEIIRARDTDRLTAKMREEVIPELMKLSPDIIKKMRESSLDLDGMSDENNPEWEEILEKNGIAGKLREFTEMQMEGADLMMVSFANLKGFPFFRTINSWFLPFDAQNPAIKIDSGVIKSLETAVSMNKMMCDSDKYSLFLAFASMPEQQRSMMFGQFEQQMSQMMEDIKEKGLKDSHAEFNSEAIIFIRDLYRFYKLFGKRAEFKDPFDHPLNFMTLPYLNNMLIDDEMVAVVGEFYFKRGYYPEALALLSKIEKTQGLKAEYWEKIGFINQQLGNYQDSLMAYQKSELLGDSGLWLLKNMATVNTKIGNYRAAAEYYQSALEKDQENVSLIMNTAYCMSRIDDYTAAVKLYYHAHYLQPDNLKVLRALAWGELMNGNLEKSESFYNKIPEKDTTVIDYLNMGHLNLVAGKVKEAVKFYKKAKNNNEAEFIDAFKADEEVLNKLGVDSFSQHLIMDAIAMGE